MQMQCAPPPRVSAPSRRLPVESFGCGALREAEAPLLDVSLTTPFTTTSSCLETVSNVAVHIKLRSGAVR